MPFSLDPIVLAIAAEFERHEMRDHLTLLRAFYRSYRAHKRWLRVQDRPPWDSEMVIEWARILRIPPFEHAYPVLENGATCPKCAANKDPLADSAVRMAWAGGWLMQCHRCSECWLQLSGK
jgi:hypothetical protein